MTSYAIWIDLDLSFDGIHYWKWDLYSDLCEGFYYSKTHILESLGQEDILLKLVVI